MPHVVLVVEDDEAMRYVLRQILTGAGYQVLEAADGVDALEVFRAHRNDIAVLLTNIVMPRLNGLDLARVVTEEKPEIGVLYISAQTKPEFDLLRKPFTPTELVERIQALIAKRDAAEAG